MDNKTIPQIPSARPLPAVTLIILLTAATALSALSVSFTLPFILLASGILSFVILRTEKITPALIALPAYAIAVLISGSPLIALIALIPIPPAITCAKAVRGNPRSISTAMTAAALAAILLILTAVDFIAATGSISPEAIRSFFDEQTALLATAVTESINANLSALPEELASEQTLLSPENVKALFDGVLPLIPGYFAACAYALAYVIHILQSGLCSLFGPNTLPAEARSMRPSVISAYVFSIVYVIVMLFSAVKTNSTVFLILCRNLIVILTIPFAICGIGGLRFRFKRSRGTLTAPLIILAAIFFTLLNPAAVLNAAAFLGVIDSFVRRYGSSNYYDDDYEDSDYL